MRGCSTVKSASNCKRPGCWADVVTMTDDKSSARHLAVQGSTSGAGGVCECGRIASGASLSAAAVERIAHRLSVLGQEVRIRLVLTLSSRESLSVSELAETVGMSVHDVSQHLAALQAEGVVRSARDGRRMRYWLDDPSATAVYELVLARMREQIDRERLELLNLGSEKGRSRPSGLE